jgi:hypothetical protein
MWTANTVKDRLKRRNTPKSMHFSVSSCLSFLCIVFILYSWLCPVFSTNTGYASCEMDTSHGYHYCVNKQFVRSYLDWKQLQYTCQDRRVNVSIWIERSYARMISKVPSPKLCSLLMLVHLQFHMSCFHSNFFFHPHFWQNLGPLSSVWVRFG